LNEHRLVDASAMGAVFAPAAGSHDIASASASAVAHGMRVSFAVATILIVSALAIAARGRAGDRDQPLS